MTNSQPDGITMAELEQFHSDVDAWFGKGVDVRDNPLHFAMWKAGKARALLANKPAAAEATDPENCDAWCPRCQGAGEETVLSGSGPDAYEQIINCQHCDGGGTLYHAYSGIVRSLEESRKAHLEACGKLWAARIAPPQSSIRFAALEEAANICDAISAKYENKHDDRSSGANDCANKIRNLTEQPVRERVCCRMGCDTPSACERLGACRIDASAEPANGDDHDR